MKKKPEKENQFYIPYIQHTLHMANWFYYIIIHGSVALVIIGVHGSLCKKKFFYYMSKNAMVSLFNVNGNFYEETFFCP